MMMKSPSNEIEVARFWIPLGNGVGWVSFDSYSLNLYMKKTRSCNFKALSVAIRFPKYEAMQVMDLLNKSVKHSLSFFCSQST